MRLRRPTAREIASVTFQIIWGLAGLFVVCLATPVSAAVGGLVGILAGFGCILLGMLMIAFMQ